MIGGGVRRPIPQPDSGFPGGGYPCTHQSCKPPVLVHRAVPRRGAISSNFPHDRENRCASRRGGTRDAHKRCTGGGGGGGAAPPPPPPAAIAPGGTEPAQPVARRPRRRRKGREAVSSSRG